MKILKYKGIAFDDYAQNEDGTFWAEICQECVKKHYDTISAEIDDGGTARCFCSVKGCFNNGENADFHFYIDFNNENIVFEEDDESNAYDEQYI